MLGGDHAPSISIAVGIVVGLLASFVQSLGLTIQRKSHIQNQLKPESEQKVEHRRPLWLFGFTIFISSNVLGSIFQVASLPVVILAPLGAVSLLWNAFFAKFLLGDVFSLWLILGTLLISGGAALIGIFGTVPEVTRSLDDLLELFARPPFIGYFSMLGAAVFVGLIITHIAEFSLRKKLQALPHILPTVVPAREDTSVVVQTETTPLLDPKLPVVAMTQEPSVVRARMLLAISYASASGILSGMCLIFAKSGVELLILTIGGDNQFWRWQAWMLLLGLLVFALLQLWYLHKALIHADPTIVCPLAFCFYNLSSIVNGLIYYNQFNLLPTPHIILVIVGIFVLLAGVWTLSIQGGGKRGVDLGTFQEDNVDETASDTLETDTAVERVPRSPSIRNTFSSAVDHNGHLEPSSPGAQDVRDARHRWPPMASPSDFPQSHSIPQLSTSTLPRLSTSTHSRPRHRRFISLFASQDDQNNLGTPLIPAGGFSIGLSPISPGFAVVPQQRRRVSMHTIAEEARVRRAVSESDVGSHARSSEPIVSTREMTDGSHQARARWRWLRTLVTGE
ncbi:hypothetical protein SISNIDRAFT_485899 [Sistotremastrum niveocremeum HHB9708]|uniref:DUF803-domain-containing protein n=1 Tax=Sistotremastrum niveocremeum HHB9708 TaxID=1314777 RepID=A0A164U606_9AGAM|nr:hypothetical protein SISNIDRAFT_485899 [Sistotremastrum niveocremeum HHB9708]